VQFGYGFNYLIDVEHAVIVDVEATPAIGVRAERSIAMAAAAKSSSIVQHQLRCFGRRRVPSLHFA
jgi:hypothetical protein